MAEIIRMPKMSDTMQEGVIAAWLKKVGDTVKTGDILAEVETDKATMELESYEEGTLLYIGVKEKESVPVDGVIAIIGKEGENIDALLAQINGSGVAAAAPAPSATPATAPSATPAPAPVSAPVAAAPAVDTSNIKATIIRMPKMSDTMQEGVIVAWHKKVGDKVKAGDLMAEVETDKATMELESYEDGTLLYIGVEAGKSVPVDGIIAVIGEPGADFQALLSASNAPAAASSAAPAAASAPVVATSSAATATATTSSDSRIKASPLAKKIAEEKGIDIRQVKGSGENGRIVRRDVESFTPSASPSKTPTAATTTTFVAPLGQESFEEVPVSQMRKVIARRLSESLFTAPHFYLTMEINMDKAIEARTSINSFIEGKVSFNDMVIKAVAMALRKHPEVNSAWLGDKIRYNKHVHIGMAVAIPDGLIVPVIRFADTKSLAQLSAEAKDLGKKAKERKLQPSDWEGNTFTISNLGMFGIDEFTAIINPPDTCILAVGGIKEQPVVKNGQIVVGNVMKVTLSCDHRVVDGAMGAAFLQTFKSLLEEPVRLLA